MLKTLEKALAEVGSHYEISHGTLLGALKVKGFLPWDVDGDLFVPGPIPMPFFKKGGRGRALLEEAGISGTQRSKISVNLKEIAVQPTVIIFSFSDPSLR